MKRNRQYTIRSIPATVDRALRDRARVEGKSLNQTALDALSRGAGVQPETQSHHDLDDLIGTWEEDADFDRALAAQDVVDRRLWR